MGKKKFIDKKKSATFHLMARDSSDPNYTPDPSGDRVFVRVDNNPYDFDEGEGNSVFADAPEDDNGEENANLGGIAYGTNQTTSLPDHVRKEILELGFPDDGYNYLTHLREIKNTGGGSAYYENPKADFQLISNDVKAYDASRVVVPKINDVAEEKLMYSVAAKTVGVKLQRVVDPEVAALLDDSDSSQIGSDDEDLEEDFVIQANDFEGQFDDEFEDEVDCVEGGVSSVSGAVDNDAVVSGLDSEQPRAQRPLDEQPRARRPLDEQFDMLELQEYGTEGEEEYNGLSDDENECQESLAEKLNHAFKNRPTELLHHDGEVGDIESPELAAEVIRRCKEYAEKYEDGNDEEVVFVEESSDEAEAWDCETIVTTYSTLDNHPGKIGAPEARRKKKLAETFSGASAVPDQVITLKGKERLPVDFLPRSKKHVEDKITAEKDVNNKQNEQQKRKPRSEESKEEKKERKSALKSERREARQMKKEMKGLYKSEAHRAQKVAAFTGPSSIHLM